jgi:hypothetical protein
VTPPCLCARLVCSRASVTQVRNFVLSHCAAWPRCRNRRESVPSSVEMMKTRASPAGSERFACPPIVSNARLLVTVFSIRMSEPLSLSPSSRNRKPRDACFWGGCMGFQSSKSIVHTQLIFEEIYAATAADDAYAAEDDLQRSDTVPYDSPASGSASMTAPTGPTPLATPRKPATNPVVPFSPSSFMMSWAQHRTHYGRGAAGSDPAGPRTRPTLVSVLVGVVP